MTIRFDRDAMRDVFGDARLSLAGLRYEMGLVEWLLSFVLVVVSVLSLPIQIVNCVKVKFGK